MKTVLPTSGFFSLVMHHYRTKCFLLYRNFLEISYTIKKDRYVITCLFIVILYAIYFHSAKIFDLNWSEDSKFLISGSLDESVMLWKMENKSRLKNYPCIDGDQINSAVIINANNDFVCGGYSCTIELVTV